MSGWVPGAKSAWMERSHSTIYIYGAKAQIVGILLSTVQLQNHHKNALSPVTYCAGWWWYFVIIIQDIGFLLVQITIIYCCTVVSLGHLAAIKRFGAHSVATEELHELHTMSLISFSWDTFCSIVSKVTFREIRNKSDIITFYRFLYSRSWEEFRIGNKLHCTIMKKNYLQSILANADT